MKKKLLTLMIVTSLIFCTACGGPSEQARNVIVQISAIGEVNEDSLSALENVRNMYEELTEEEKADVSNYNILVEAENTYNTIFADKVEVLIGQIGEIGDDSKPLIVAAREAYDSLNDTQKSMVENYNVLESAETEYRAYIVNRAVDALNGINDASVEDVEAIQMAMVIYEKLDDDEKAEVENTVGDVETILTNARVHIIDKKLAKLEYDGDEPTKVEALELLEVMEMYVAIDPSARQLLADPKRYKKISKDFRKYMKEREKTDKIFARRIYIAECVNLPYSDMLDYPKSYKDSKVVKNIKIIAGNGGGLFGIGSYISAIDTDTNEILEVKDYRNVQEPIIRQNDTFTIYGTYEGFDTIKAKEAKKYWPEECITVERNNYDVPIIKFIYTSNDNLGIIATGNPAATIEDANEDLEAAVDRLSEIFESLAEED